MRPAIAIPVVGLILLALLVWSLRPGPPSDTIAIVGTTESAPRSAAPPEREAPPPLGPPTENRDAPLPGSPDVIDAPDDTELNSEGMYDSLAQAWSNVDLDEVRRKMPDNLYFKLAAPTTDEAVIEERAAERARWNVEYGKMLSGTGTEEEIRAYYDMRARLSGDYVEFTTHLLDNYREVLPERDVALLELARRMHLSRLEEIPRQVEEARERKRKQDEARAAWLADEAEMR